MRKQVLPLIKAVKAEVEKPFSEKMARAQQLIKLWARPDAKSCVSISFGKDSMIVLYLALQANPKIPVVFENTLTEFPETLQFARKITESWGLNFFEVKPEKGINFWTINDRIIAQGLRLDDGRKHSNTCCYHLKERPFTLWRRKQGITRSFTGVTAVESRNRMFTACMKGMEYYSKKDDLWKVHPIMYWTGEEVWAFIHDNAIPINPAYSKYGLNRLGCSWCFPDETVVYGDNTEFKELTLFSQICTTGGLENPIELMERTYSGDLVLIKPVGLEQVRVTPEHPILTCKWNRRIIWERTNRRRPQRMGHINDFYYKKRRVNTRSPIIWKDADALSTDDYLLIPRKKDFNDFNDLTLAWLLGLYLAEGYPHIDKKKRHSTIFTLGKHETALISKLIQLLKLKFGSACVSNVEESVTRITCYGRKAYDFFTLAGANTDSKTKRIPALIKNANSGVVRSFIDAYVAGDGNESKNYLKTGSSIKQVRLDMVELLTMTMGILPTMYMQKQPTEICGRKVKVNPFYMIAWSKNRWNNSNFINCYFADADFLYVPIAELGKVHVDGIRVQNMATPSQTYCVPFVVHNCMSYQGWREEVCRINRKVYCYMMKRYFGTPTLMEKAFNEEQVMEVMEEN